jgi:hypothetical protein
MRCVSIVDFDIFKSLVWAIIKCKEDYYHPGRNDLVFEDSMTASTSQAQFLGNNRIKQQFILGLTPTKYRSSRYGNICCSM